jgi:tetratricopeptide (TPR) repeat protein/Mg-chelatase subunit ChlD
VSTEHEHVVARGHRPWALFFIVLTTLALGVMVILLREKPPAPLDKDVRVTVADLSPVHSTVKVGTEEVRSLTRLSVGDVVETNEAGRARLRLDNGTTAVCDGATRLEITAAGFKVLSGRVFIDAKSSPSTLDLEAGTITAVGSTVFVDRRKKTTAYVASGEVTARAGGKESPVATGDSVDFEGGLKVRPERGFDDWTAGLAAPWAANGALRRAVGEIWGRTAPGEIGSPLTIRSQAVEATVLGEMAKTVVRTTFFNAGDQPVLGDYRAGIPKSALVSRFRTSRAGRWAEARLALSNRSQVLTFEAAQSLSEDALEWAGDGWVRGRIASIQPGQVITVEITYVEWLRVTVAGTKHQVQYRYPLVSEDPAPLIADFSVTLDASPARATRVAAGMGATVDQEKVVLKKSDFRATADFVVDVEIPAELPSARGYVVDTTPDEEEVTFAVRTEAPRLSGKEEGVTLAIVLDTSASMDPAFLAAGRAFVEALLGGLSSTDRVAVFAADSTSRAMGPAEIGVADGARKAAIIKALGEAQPGGATDVGRALEVAANSLPSDAPSAMVVYVGDGFPSVGDRSAEAVIARLSRRKAGVPRLGGVLVGPSSNRRMFAELTRGSGFLTEIADTEDAARASVDLLGTAIVPTVTGVSADLGPSVLRVYPRSESAIAQGETLFVVGKLVGTAPRELKLSYKQGETTKTEVRPITLTALDDAGDLDRRWADARASSMALAGRGREAVTDAALKAKLLTPWTHFTTDPRAEAPASPLTSRVLDLGGGGEPFSVSVGGEGATFRALSSAEDAATPFDGTPLEASLQFAVMRVLDEARGQMKACRDARLALKPDLPPTLRIRLKVDGEGKASDVAIDNAGDEALARCLVTIVENLPYPRVYETVTVVVSHSFTWPVTETLRGKKCSPTSTLAVPLRRGVWRERLDRKDALSVYVEAKRGCELASWTAKRSLLELILGMGNPMAHLDVAAKLTDLDEQEAAGFLRREVVRRADPARLALIRRTLLSQERLPYVTFSGKYEKAADDAARLEVVKTFLALAPHDRRLRGLLLSLLSSLGNKATLAEEIARLRVDPFADAGLIAQAAHLLRKGGDDAEARRTFGEIAERASEDPWALSFVGDALRAEGWHDEAAVAYEALLALAPGDGSAELRLALAHVGAGRIDVALRRLGTIGRTGGRDGVAELGLVAERLAAVTVREVIAAESTSAADRAGLQRTLAEMPGLPLGQAFLVRPPTGRGAPKVWLELGPADPKGRELLPPEAILGKVGLVALRVAPGKSGEVLVVLSRDRELPPVEPYVVRVTALVGDQIKSTDVEVPNTGERVEVPWDGAAFGTPRIVKGQTTQ